MQIEVPNIILINSDIVIITLDNGVKIKIYNDKLLLENDCEIVQEDL